MHPILCIYPCWYDSTAIVRRQWGVMVASLAKPTKKIAWNECDIEMRETRGALGRLATKSLNFLIKEGTKVLSAWVCECVCMCERGRMPDSEQRLGRWWMYDLIHLRASEWQRKPDRQRQRENEWYQDAGSGTEDSHWHPSLLQGSECGVCLSLCACVLSVEKTISPDAGIWGLDRHQEVLSILQSLNPSVFLYTVCVCMWVACVLAYLPPMKC